MAELHPLVELARESIECYVREGRRAAMPAVLSSEMGCQAGVFVSIHRHGDLRGCIGTLQPNCMTVAEEVIENAIAAATRDPRFRPLRNDELADIKVKVDVLTEPEPVDSLAELDPRRYGLIVQSRRETWRRGVLLPDLEGIDTVEQQVFWTRHHKAGITDPNEPVQMFRFEVHRYE